MYACEYAFGLLLLDDAYREQKSAREMLKSGSGCCRMQRKGLFDKCPISLHFMQETRLEKCL